MIRVARVFNERRWTTFLATTYSLELELFDEYLFRRLGEPPLNASIVMDAGRHQRLWDAPDSELRRLRRANRDYLLRPVRFGSGSFHAKTYFFGREDQGVLLVGSGNLTLSGTERGREVFVRFDSQEPNEIGSLRAWREWADELIRRIDDSELSYRWYRLRETCVSWLEGEPNGSQFVPNLSQSILDTVADGLSAPVDELHVLAPFYDRGAGALNELIARLRPRRLSIYLGERTSVDGPSLVAVLEKSAAQIELRTVEPHEFVHAKLIGVIQGNKGRLLSGSANLSNAALTAAVDDEAWVNVEVAVATDTSPDRVRAAFTPPEHRWREASLEHVQELAYAGADADVVGFPVFLHAAKPEQDGRITVALEGDLPSDAQLTAGGEGQLLDEQTTVAPLMLPEGGVLVWLVDSSGEVISNKAPLDDPHRLRSWLKERHDADGRPPELDASDFTTPIGRMLGRLHESCIFDIDDTAAGGSHSSLTEAEASEEQVESWESLEELLAKEELLRDPRIGGYRHRGAHELLLDDDVLQLLRLMLDRTPEERYLRLVGAPGDAPGTDGEDGDEGEGPHTGVPWTPEQKLRVRLFNVLRRWSIALSDRRFIWIDLAAPVRNYAALLVADTECWEQGYLPEDRIVPLLGVLFETFLTSDRTRGYLLVLSEEDRQQALDRLPTEARSLGAALVYCALRHAAQWRDYIFEWQPALQAGVQLGVFEIDDETCGVVERLVGEATSTSEIEERLLWAVEYIDDEHWSRRQERELGIDHVRLTKADFNPRFGITLAVSGEGASLNDPQLVSLVRQALAYRNTSGTVVEVGPTTRLSILVGQPVWAKVDGDELASAHAFDLAQLAEMERSGISFARILRASGRVA